MFILISIFISSDAGSLALYSGLNYCHINKTYIIILPKLCLSKFIKSFLPLQP